MLEGLSVLVGLLGRAAWIVIGLHGTRGRRRDEDWMPDVAAAMSGQVANHFCSAQGVANENDVFEIEPIDDRGDVVGESVEVVTAGGILGTAVTATVEGEATPSAIRKVDQGDIPPVGAEAPWRDKDDRPADAQSRKWILVPSRVSIMVVGRTVVTLEGSSAPAVKLPPAKAAVRLPSSTSMQIVFPWPRA
jgi:hypothetical protein